MLQSKPEPWLPTEEFSLRPTRNKDGSIQDHCTPYTGILRIRLGSLPTSETSKKIEAVQRRLPALSQIHIKRHREQWRTLWPTYSGKLWKREDRMPDSPCSTRSYTTKLKLTTHNTWHHPSDPQEVATIFHFKNHTHHMITINFHFFPEPLPFGTHYLHMWSALTPLRDSSQGWPHGWSPKSRQIHVFNLHHSH